MLNFKQKVLFNIIVRDNEDILRESINSILAQEGISPFIAVSCLESKDTSFPIAKSFCENPKSYEPMIVISDKVLAARVPDEKSAITNGIAFGNESDCEYHFFMYSPGVLDPKYTKRALENLKDDVIAVYSDIIDSGVQIHTNMVGDNLNVGAFFVTKKSIANRFNVGSMSDFLKNIVNLGVFYHIPEFLVQSTWIDYILKQEKGTNKPELPLSTT